MKRTQEARIRKTNRFFKNQEAAIMDIQYELRGMARKIRNAKGYTKLAVRLNCFSDLKWEEMVYDCLGGKNIFQANPDIQFYDYTKYPYTHRPAWDGMDLNYHLTYSYDGTVNDFENVEEVLDKGKNVKVILSKEVWKEIIKELGRWDNGGSFHTTAKEVLSDTFSKLKFDHNRFFLGGLWKYLMTEYTLYNGESHDNRFLDPSPVILLGVEKGQSHIKLV